jgi:hypothetical protein
VTRAEDGRPLASEFTQSIELMNVQERLFSFLSASFDVCSVCLNFHKLHQEFAYGFLPSEAVFTHQTQRLVNSVEIAYWTGSPETQILPSGRFV